MSIFPSNLHQVPGQWEGGRKTSLAWTQTKIATQTGSDRLPNKPKHVKNDARTFLPQLTVNTPSSKLAHPHKKKCKYHHHVAVSWMLLMFKLRTSTSGPESWTLLKSFFEQALQVQTVACAFDTRSKLDVKEGLTNEHKETRTPTNRDHGHERKRARFLASCPSAYLAASQTHLASASLNRSYCAGVHDGQVESRQTVSAGFGARRQVGTTEQWIHCV